jgi:hypothetical protein
MTFNIAATKPPKAKWSFESIRWAPPVVSVDCDANAREVIGGIVVAVLIAVGMDTDAPVEGEVVIVTGINIDDTSVKVLVEVPVSWPAPDPLIVDVQVAVAVFARSHDTKAEILIMKTNGQQAQCSK